MSGAIAYARALAELAEEQACGTEVYDAVLAVQQSLKDQPKYIAVLSSPVIGKEQRKELMRSFLTDAPVVLRNTLLLMCDKNHAGLLPEMADFWIADYRTRMNILPVTAVTAIPLSDRLAEQLRLALGEVIGKTILLENQVDPGCMGGLRLKMEGRQYDGSLQSRLDDVRRLLTADENVIRKTNSARPGDNK